MLHSAPTGRGRESDRPQLELGLLRLPDWVLQHYKRRAERQGVSLRTVIRETLCAAVRGESQYDEEMGRNALTREE